MARIFSLGVLALATALALPSAAFAQHGGERGDRGRHEGWRGRGDDRGWERGRGEAWRGDRGWRGPGPGYRSGPPVAPLIGGALLGLGLGAVLGGAVSPGYAPAPGYAAPPPGYAPAPQYAPPPPAYYAPDKPPAGYYGY